MGEGRQILRHEAAVTSKIVHSSHPRFVLVIVSQIARWEIGSSLTSTSSGASASLTALATAAGAPR